MVSESVKLLNGLEMGTMSGVAYDTAWVARLSDSNGKTLFPQSLEWLLANQKRDGSWGGEVEYYHERVISTLASVITMSVSGKKMNYPGG